MLRIFVGLKKSSSKSYFCRECKNILLPKGRDKDLGLPLLACQKGHEILGFDKKLELSRISKNDFLEEIIMRKESRLSLFDCAECESMYADLIYLNHDSGSVLYNCLGKNCNAVYLTNIKSKTKYSH